MTCVPGFPDVSERLGASGLGVGVGSFKVFRLREKEFRLRGWRFRGLKVQSSGFGVLEEVSRGLRVLRTNQGLLQAPGLSKFP